MRRVIILGVTGAGKSTMAAALSQRLGIPWVELDALFWEPGWTSAPRDRFRARVAAALAGDAWIVDGNYSVARDVAWARADTVIWLDYPLPFILARLLRRILRRWWRREVLWQGNRERLTEHFFTRESLLLWALRTHPRYRREYPALFASPPYRHLAVLRFRSPREASEWLAAHYHVPGPFVR
jgi:adenylate kinase family enzyme